MVRNKYIKIASAVLMTMIGIVAAGELYSRYWYLPPGTSCIYDPLLGWKNNPGAAGCKIVDGRRNFFQYDDNGRRRSPQAPYGFKRRLLIVGDSIVDGREVSDTDHFQTRLRRLCRTVQWDVFACGVNGYGTDQEALFIQKQLKHHDMDGYGLVFFCGNDYRDNLNSLLPLQNAAVTKPYYQLQGDSLVLFNSPVPRPRRSMLTVVLRLYSSLYRYTREIIYPRVQSRLAVLKNREPRDLSLTYDLPDSADGRRAVDVTRRIIFDLKNQLHRAQKHFFIVIMPSQMYLDISGKNRGVQAIKNICSDGDIPYVDMFSIMQNAARKPGREFFFAADWHLNPEGHRLLAESIYAYWRRAIHER